MECGCCLVSKVLQKSQKMAEMEGIVTNYLVGIDLERKLIRLVYKKLPHV